MQSSNQTLKFAWMDGTTVRDVCVGDPALLFHPSIAAMFNTAVPQEAAAGDTFSGGVLTKPKPPAPPGPAVWVPPQVSPVQFMLLFSAAERVAIKSKRSTDPVIDDFFDIIEDPRLTYVDLGLQSTKDAIGYLKAKNLLTADRATAILAGGVV